MANVTPSDVLDAIGGWTVLELNQFLKDFEERFDVTAAAPVAVAPAAAPGAGGDAAAAEEQEDRKSVV